MPDQPDRLRLRPPEEKLSFLTDQAVRQIDAALRRLGPYGEVRLIVVKGRLRFIQTVRSEEMIAGAPVENDP